MVVNHETGHWLGRPHAYCSGARPAGTGDAAAVEGHAGLPGQPVAAAPRGRRRLLARARRPAAQRSPTRPTRSGADRRGPRALGVASTGQRSGRSSSDPQSHWRRRVRRVGRLPAVAIDPVPDAAGARTRPATGLRSRSGVTRARPRPGRWAVARATASRLDGLDPSDPDVRIRASSRAHQLASCSAAGRRSGGRAHARWTARRGPGADGLVPGLVHAGPRRPPAAPACCTSTARRATRDDVVEIRGSAGSRRPVRGRGRLGRRVGVRGGSRGGDAAWRAGS